MIYRNGHEVTDIRRGERPISAVYRGVRLVWEAIKSCFGKGFWVNNAPWVNGDGWRNE